MIQGSGNRCHASVSPTSGKEGALRRFFEAQASVLLRNNGPAIENAKIKETRDAIAPKLGADADLFCNHLASLMQKAGYTPRRFSSALGVPESQVLHWLSGYQVPKFQMWRTMAEFLGLEDVRDLLPKMPVR